MTDFLKTLQKYIVVIIDLEIFRQNYFFSIKQRKYTAL